MAARVIHWGTIRMKRFLAVLMLSPVLALSGSLAFSSPSPVATTWITQVETGSIVAGFPTTGIYMTARTDPTHIIALVRIMFMYPRA